MEQLELLKNISSSKKNIQDVPLPPFSWKTRIFLPFFIFFSIGTLLFIAGYETFLPVTTVTVSPVIPKQTQGSQAGTTVVQAAGWVQADPYLIHISALADGIVQDVFVLEGESVKKDQLLVQMISEDAELELRYAESNVQEKEADIETALADLKAAEKTLETLIERKRAVNLASAEVKETRAMQAKATAEIQIEEALLQKLESECERTTPLLKKDAASESDVINAHALHLAQQAKLQVAKQNYEVLQERLHKLEAEVEASKAHLSLKIEETHALEKAKARLKTAQATLASAQVRYDEKKIQLKRMKITSPLDGIVVKRYIEPGSKVLRMMDATHSSHLVSMYNPQKIQVRVDVPLADVALIQEGQHAEIIVEVLPDVLFQGKVTRIIHEANIQKNTLEVKVAILDPRPELRPEMLARVRFLAQKKDTSTTETRETLYIPQEALVQQESPFVWIVSHSDGQFGIAQKRNVQKGSQIIDGRWIEISSGLNISDLVVISPPRTLKENQRIEIVGEY